MSSGAETYSQAVAGADNYMRWLVRVLGPWLKSPLLEAGVGHASLRGFLPPELEYIGVDIDAESVAAARRRWPGDSFFQGRVGDPDLSPVLAARGPAAVLAVNVLEHIADDAEAFREMLGLLRQGGHLVALMPALPFLYNDLDRLAGHHRRYRRRDLKRLLPSGQGEMVVNRYFNPLGGAGWLANRLLRWRSLNEAGVDGQIRLFDRYLIPVSRVLDPLFRGWFGQSVLWVVRKT